MNTRWLLLLALLFSLAPASAQEWTRTTRLLVVPGQSVGVIYLGQPLPAEASSLYGAPTSYSEPTPGPEGQDTGSVVFGKTAGFDLTRGLLVKLNDGRSDSNVYSIIAADVRAYTAEGVTMGMSQARAKRIYPQAARGTDEMSGLPTLSVPGLTMVFANDRLVEMAVRAR